jgi:hypothetical protein
MRGGSLLGVLCVTGCSAPAYRQHVANKPHQALNSRDVQRVQVSDLVFAACDSAS